MAKACLNILIFDHDAPRTRHLRMHKATFRIGSCLIAFALFSIALFFGDYIQVRKNTYEISRLRQEMNVQMSQIQFLSGGINNLERQLSKLKNLGRRIHVMANLQGIEERREDGPERFERRSILLQEKVTPEGVADVKVYRAGFPETKREQ